MVSTTHAVARSAGAAGAYGPLLRTADTPEQLLAPALPHPDGPAGESGAVADRPVQLDLFDPAHETDPAPVVGTGPAWVPERAAVTPQEIAEYAAAAVAGVETRRWSWTPLNLLAETARATRDLRMASVMDRMLRPDGRRVTLPNLLW